MEILTVPEAAQFAKLSKSTLDKARVTGSGPLFVKVGGAVRYRRSDLEEWLASRVVRSTSEADALKILQP